VLVTQRYKYEGNGDKGVGWRERKKREVESGDVEG
jgi:predicted secreted protein